MSPRTKEQNEAIREARIRQIRSAAASVYLSRGIGFEMRDVAAHAGLGYGTVYHYYRNKHELFGELLQNALEAAAALTRRMLDGERPLAERLRDWAVGLLRLWAEDAIVFILYKMASENFHQLPAPTVGRLPERFEAELLQPVVEALRSASGDGVTDAPEAASVLFGSLIGCAGIWLYRGSAEWNAERIADRLLRGLGVRSIS